MLSAVGESDIAEIISQLVKMAREGDVRAAREVLDRCLGRPVEADLLERLDELEIALSELKASGS